VEERKMAGGLYQRLWYMAERQISQANLHLTYDGQQALQDFIENGVHRITNLHDEHVAQRNLEFFVSQAVKIASASGFGFLDSSIIERVKRALCPLHPFC
jgi:hypothetical protein